MDTKYCNKCNKAKSTADFHKQYAKKSGFTSKCKDCCREYGRQYFQKNKEKFQERKRNYRKQRRELIQSFKDKPCMDCEIQYPYYVMEFDHRKPEDKEFLISQAVWGYKSQSGKRRKIKSSDAVGEDRLLKEIDKCDVVCSNCHRIRTHNRRVGY